MFSVLFEVHPKPDQWDAYLGYVKMLRPELEQVEGFVDNIQYRSLNREGLDTLALKLARRKGRRSLADEDEAP